MRLRDIGETGLIRRIAKSVRTDGSVVKGIGDDAAVLTWTAKKYQLFTCDMLVEDVHFTRRTATPFEIGWKALGRNISDIAAMGGVPRHAVVSVGIDPALPVAFAENLFKGILALAKRFKINIVGGDTVRSKKLVIDIALIGEVEKKNLVRRDGARPGDVIFVTGTLGGSIKGKHLRCMPRVAEARAIVKKYKVNAMIDISDGLALDLARILDASSAGARIYQSAVPVAQEALSFDAALTDGEDFELLFTMSKPEARRFLATGRAKFETPVTMIGSITEKRSGCALVRPDGRVVKLAPKGYLHF